MPKKKKKTGRNILIGIGVISLILLVFFFAIPNIQFQFGNLPYGESVNSITDLNLVSKDTTLLYSSKYWDIEQIDTKIGIFSQRQERTFSGSDLEFKSATPQGDGARRDNPQTKTIITSTEYFNEKDFMAQFVGFSGSLNNVPSGDVSFGSIFIDIDLIGDSGEVNVLHHLFVQVKNPPALNIVIHPSVIDNTIEIFVNGQKTKEIFYEGKYKVRNSMTSSCGSTRIGHGLCDVFITMKNPSYKQDFGCTKEPGEQFYSSIFREGDRVNINKLEQFKKFCLEETPLTVYSNIGLTTETSPLAKLVNDEEFVVPEGQIWRIDFIGDLTTFKTQCEANKIYSNDDDTCLARAVLTTKIENEIIGIIETKPAIYQPSKISTHETLENNGKFRFTHIRSDSEDITPNSIIIGDSVFSSQEFFYDGIKKTSFTYPEDKFNWEAVFNFNNKEFRGIETKFNLDEQLSVELTDLQGFYDYDTQTVEDFKIEYTFEINTDFISIDYSNQEIVVTNNYKDFDGGIVLTTTDNTGTTNVEKIEKSLKKGDTKFDLDTKNLLEAKIRPFILVKTPNFDYNLETKDALTIDLDSEGLVKEIESKQKDFPILLIFFLVIAAILIILSVIFLRRKK